MSNENAALREVLKYQQDVKEAEGLIVTLQAAIANQREQIQRANSFTTNVPELLGQRENLLADIALKKKDRQELEQLDATIAVARQELAANKANAAKVVPDAEAAIVGLERQLSVAKDSLTLLLSCKPKVVYDFLLSEAEQIGEEYAAGCMAVIAKYRNLLALDAIISSTPPFDKSKTIQTGWGVALELPLFKLKTLKALGDSSRPGFEARVHEAELIKHDRSLVNAEVGRERARIIGLGVEL